MTFYKARAPSLPVAADEYNRMQQDQFANALRLYFNRLDSFLTELSANSGGGLLGFPSGAFLDTQTQRDGSTTTAYRFQYDTTTHSTALS